MKIHSDLQLQGPGLDIIFSLSRLCGDLILLPLLGRFCLDRDLIFHHHVLCLGYVDLVFLTTISISLSLHRIPLPIYRTDACVYLSRQHINAETECRAYIHAHIHYYINYIEPVTFAPWRLIILVPKRTL